MLSIWNSIRTSGLRGLSNRGGGRTKGLQSGGGETPKTEHPTGESGYSGGGAAPATTGIVRESTGGASVAGTPAMATVAGGCGCTAGSSWC